MLLDLAAPTSSERLLDVATGTGAVLSELALRAQRPHDALGVDFSTAMLERVGSLPAGWSLAQGNACALPFGESAFDVATVSYLLHTLSGEDRGRALGELARILRPGGRLAVLTPVIPPHRLLRPLGLALDRLATIWPQRCVGLRALDPRAELASAGFQLLTARYSFRGYPSICVLARRSAAKAAA